MILNATMFKVFHFINRSIFELKEIKYVYTAFLMVIGK